jgi:hypothetical protein
MKRLIPQFVDYRRNYVDLNGAFIFEGAATPDFDVVTEIWFKDRKAYEEMVAIVSQPDIAKQIADDEENVFDRSKTRLFVGEENRSPQ